MLEEGELAVAALHAGAGALEQVGTEPGHGLHVLGSLGGQQPERMVVGPHGAEQTFGGVAQDVTGLWQVTAKAYSGP